MAAVFRFLPIKLPQERKKKKKHKTQEKTKNQQPNFGLWQSFQSFSENKFEPRTHPFRLEFQESSKKGNTLLKKRFVLSVHLLLCLLQNTFEKSGDTYTHAKARTISSSPEREACILFFLRVKKSTHNALFLKEKESGVYFCRE